MDKITKKKDFKLLIAFFFSGGADSAHLFYDCARKGQSSA